MVFQVWLLLHMCYIISSSDSFRYDREHYVLVHASTLDFRWICVVCPMVVLLMRLFHRYLLKFALRVDYRLLFDQVYVICAVMLWCVVMLWQLFAQRVVRLSIEGVGGDMRIGGYAIMIIETGTLLFYLLILWWLCMNNQHHQCLHCGDWTNWYSFVIDNSLLVSPVMYPLLTIMYLSIQPSIHPSIYLSIHRQEWARMLSSLWTLVPGQ